MEPEYTIGQRALCTQCGKPIVFVGPYWDHPGEMKPRHPAIPGELLETHKVEMHLDLDAIEQHVRAAHAKVSALCHGEERWTMSVPARPNDDPDLVIGQALRDADKMLVALRSLLAEDA